MTFIVYKRTCNHTIPPNCQMIWCQIAKWNAAKLPNDIKNPPSQCKGDSTIYLNSKLKESIASWEFVNTTMSLTKANLYWFSLERVSMYKS